MENVRSIAAIHKDCVSALGSDVVKITGKYVSATKSKDKVKVSLVDLWSAVGILSFNCVSPKGDDQTAELTINGDVMTGKQLHVFMKDTIFSGFSKVEKELMLSDVKSLDDQIKFERRTLWQKINSILKDIKNALNKREEKENGGAGSTTRAADVRITAFLNDAKKVCQSLKGDEITFNITDTVSGIDLALGAVGKKV